MRVLSCIGSILLVGLAASSEVAASTGRQVPEQYPTIQAAIDAAVSGDRIQIAPGNYDEPLVIRAKHLVLEGDGFGISRLMSASISRGGGRTASPWPSPHFLLSKTGRRPGWTA